MSDTTWTLLGYALGVFLLTICGAAVISDHLRRRELERATANRYRMTCPRCGDPGVLHMDAHLALAHGERAWALEDDPRFGDRA